MAITIKSHRIIASWRGGRLGKSVGISSPSATGAPAPRGSRHVDDPPLNMRVSMRRRLAFSSAGSIDFGKGLVDRCFSVVQGLRIRLC